MLPLLVLSPFFVAPVAALVGARRPAGVRWLALWPAALAFIFSGILFGQVAVTGPVAASWPWASSLGLGLQFNFDGLGLLFALLITVIGALVVWYASAYLDGHRDLPRLMAALFMFMGAMLGVALSDNLVLLFVFWELTGFTSYLLIGFEHDKLEARRAAIQAFVVTGAGGLCLLAGAVLLTQLTPATTISAMVPRAGEIATHAAYPWIAAFIMLAAFTKSAQTPFHFWLPGAMAAPTPISAYLHSATMVKAGVYLLARMTPVLGGTELWTTTLLAVGGTTMAVGAWRAVQEVDLKRILAYSTVSALGALVFMLGIGTRGAIVAAIAYLIAHASYKGTLFMVAGVIDHETGSRDVTTLGGLRSKMPRTALAAGLAAASMLGMPLFAGFLAKELFYEAGWTSPWPGAMLAVAVGASVFLGVAGLLAGWGPFAGRPGSAGDHAHDPPVAMWFGPLVLASAGLIIGAVPKLVEGVVSLAVASATGEFEPVHLALWHGLTPVLGFSALTLLLAVTLYSQRRWLRRLWPRAVGTQRVYLVPLRMLDAISGAVGPALYRGSLRGYMLVLIVSSVVLLTAALFVGGWSPTMAGPVMAVRGFEVVIAGLIIVAAVAAARSTSSMHAVLALGMAGYGVALLFVFNGAPDLAMTQFSVETLTVVIFVLVFRMFGSFAHLSSRSVRIRDAVVSGVLGVLVTVLVLTVGTVDASRHLSDFYAEAAPLLAHGRNIVNVILVDFRGLDTMGEITVLAVAAIGVHALLRIGADDRRQS